MAIAAQKLMHDFTGASARSLKRIEAEEGPPEISPAEDAGRMQAKISWLQSQVTQDVIKNMSDEYNSLVDQAIVLACSYPQHENPHQVIHLLVRASQIKTLINKYATT